MRTFGELTSSLIRRQGGCRIQGAALVPVTEKDAFVCPAIALPEKDAAFSVRALGLAVETGCPIVAIIGAQGGEEMPPPL